MDAMRGLIKAAWGAEASGFSAGDFTRRVMLAVARAESERFRRKAQWTIIAAAACLVGLIFTMPVDAIIQGVGGTIEAVSGNL